MTRIFAFILSIPLCASLLATNPFAIDFPEKENLTNEDYIEIQRQLRTIDIIPTLEELYVPDEGYTTLNDFTGRCSRGIHQILIDPEKGLFPSTHLDKIGRGGDRCFVSCVPLDGVRSEWVKTISKTLEEEGFNGYFLYQIGGFPNPTGKEIQYVGVPYSFKIFMMMEAQKRGFNNVIWIDSALTPLQNPTYFFDYLEQHGAVLQGWQCNYCWPFIFPQTRELLREHTGTDAPYSIYLNTMIFGFKMNDPLTQRMVKKYYEMAELGTPFLSCFPEEFVLTAILGQPEFGCWPRFYNDMLLKSEDNFEGTPEEIFKLLKERGYFFCLRRR